jgi:broad specificity phosphatase PhoE
MHIYLIRHGLSLANAEGLIQGHSDSGLSEVGIAQAKLLGRYFDRERIHPEIIFSSPLKRAHHTAQLIADSLDYQTGIITNDSFMEIDVGELSGTSIEAAYEKYPHGWSRDINKWLDFSLAGGESFRQFFARVEKATLEITKDWDFLDDRTVFFVAHAGVLRPLIKTLLSTESDMMFFTFGNCCHIRLTFRQVSNSIRKVMSDLMKIETVAKLMGEENPFNGFEDTVGKKIG